MRKFVTDIKNKKIKDYGKKSSSARAINQYTPY